MSEMSNTITPSPAPVPARRRPDVVQFALGGGLLGSAGVGCLATLFGLPDTDATRITGIAIGAIVFLTIRHCTRDA
ncbi:MAG: hypothetical protein RIQ38_2089 [Pseudomonadota bacterium]